MTLHRAMAVLPPGAGHLAAWLSDREPRPPGMAGRGWVLHSGLSPHPSRRLLPRAWWVCCSCRASRVKFWPQYPVQLPLGSAQGCLPALGIAPALLCDAGRGSGTQGVSGRGLGAPTPVR